MIDWYPHIDVLKGANLLSTDDDTDEVAQVLYNHYKDKLAEKKNIVLLMGHGNPDVNYNANTKYSEVQTALHTLATNKKYLRRYCRLWRNAFLAERRGRESCRSHPGSTCRPNDSQLSRLHLFASDEVLPGQ